MYIDYYKALLKIPLAAIQTVEYTAISVCCGLFIAILLTVGNFSKFRIISFLCRMYVSIFRGTPVLLQLGIIYFAIPSAIHIDINVFTAGILCFSLNSAAYISEIIRGGYLSIDKGQFEAAECLNIAGFKKYYYIIGPQIFQKILPALMNEFISLAKETAIISYVGGYDIMRSANIVASQYYTFFGPLVVAGLTYYIITISMSCFAKYIENKLSIYG